MAVDKEIQVKVSIDPFQEVDKKKWQLMVVKEIGLKKPGRFDVSGKFTVTSAKWDKRKLEAQARAIFKYDLALFASQVWQDFAPIEKSKNGQDKKTATSKFLKAVPKLQKAMVKNLNEKFVEFQEDIASGAADDAGELKGTRKGLNPAQAKQVGGMAKRMADKFDEEFDKLKTLKDAITRGSGDEKAKATEELEKALPPAITLLAKQLDGVMKGMDKVISPIQSTPAAMLKSIKKEMSDAAIAEYKKSAKELQAALKPLETAISNGKKNAIEALKKMKGKDFASGVKTLGSGGLHKIDDSAGKLSDTVKTIDGKLKKLEQAAKSR